MIQILQSQYFGQINIMKNAHFGFVKNAIRSDDMTILEFTDIELEIEDLEARAKGLDEDEGADVLGVITGLPWREAGLTDGVSAELVLVKHLDEEVVEDEDHVGVDVEERWPLGEEGHFGRKARFHERKARYYRSKM